MTWRKSRAHVRRTAKIIAYCLAVGFIVRGIFRQASACFVKFDLCALTRSVKYELSAAEFISPSAGCVKFYPQAAKILKI